MRSCRKRNLVNINLKTCAHNQKMNTIYKYDKQFSRNDKRLSRLVFEIEFFFQLSHVVILINIGIKKSLFVRTI